MSFGLPNLPTDSLIKFMAVLFLTLIVWGFYKEFEYIEIGIGIAKEQTEYERNRQLLDYKIKQAKLLTAFINAKSAGARQSIYEAMKDSLDYASPTIYEIALGIDISVTGLRGRLQTIVNEAYTLNDIVNKQNGVKNVNIEIWKSRPPLKWFAIIGSVGFLGCFLFWAYQQVTDAKGEVLQVEYNKLQAEKLFLEIETLKRNLTVVSQNASKDAMTSPTPEEN